MTGWKSELNPIFRSSFAEDIFNQKYAHEGAQTWDELCNTLVDDVCSTYMKEDEKGQLKEYMRRMLFIPGGRYLYYAGRPRKFLNNCYLLKALKDTREDWAELSKKAELCLSTGGGIGVDYSIYRPSGSLLHGTGGYASGPIAKMEMLNEIGRFIMQGGSRRSAIYASLNWEHADVDKFLEIKNWHNTKVGGTDKTLSELKEADFNTRAPLDMTNISVNYGTKWLCDYWNTGDYGDIFLKNCEQSLSTSEPGFSFNFFDQERETLRNACGEITSADDSDVCNLGSINFSRIENIYELSDVVNLATKFLICGTLKADLPYQKVYQIREKNRRLGLGLMGLHEWLIQKGYKYEVIPELNRWLTIYRSVARATATSFSGRLTISNPIATCAIAPTGSIGILAGTTTGIEPIFAVAYKRRYLKGIRWYHQIVIDGAGQDLIERYGVDPDSIETSLQLANDYEKRIKFQADIQDYVDQGISSTINIPKWGSDKNNPDTVKSFADCLASYAHRLRGFTVYADGSRGGQPLTPVPYSEARKKTGEVFEEAIEYLDVCELTQRGGYCGQ